MWDAPHLDQQSTFFPALRFFTLVQHPWQEKAQSWACLFPLERKLSLHLTRLFSLENMKGIWWPFQYIMYFISPFCLPLVTPFISLTFSPTKQSKRNYGNKLTTIKQELNMQNTSSCKNYATKFMRIMKGMLKWEVTENHRLGEWASW